MKAFFALICALVVALANANWITNNANTWLNPPVPYSQSAYYNGYRQDCSGYVSMSWALGSSYVTWTLPQVSHQIDKSQLSEGDIMLNVDEHVLIFSSWANAEQSYYWAYEQTPPNTIYHQVQYPYWSGYGVYVPYRMNGMAANGTVVQTPAANVTAPVKTMGLRGAN